MSPPSAAPSMSVGARWGASMRCWRLVSCTTVAPCCVVEFGACEVAGDGEGGDEYEDECGCCWVVWEWGVYGLCVSAVGGESSEDAHAN